MRRALLFSVLAVTLSMTAFAHTVNLAQGGAFLSGRNNGLRPDAIVFSGAFPQTVSWTLISLPDGTHNYTLTATSPVEKSTEFKSNADKLELAINTSKGAGSTTISNDDPNVVVPE